MGDNTETQNARCSICGVVEDTDHPQVHLASDGHHMMASLRLELRAATFIPAAGLGSEGTAFE